MLVVRGLALVIVAACLCIPSIGQSPVRSNDVTESCKQQRARVVNNIQRWARPVRRGNPIWHETPQMRQLHWCASMLSTGQTGSTGCLPCAQLLQATPKSLMAAQHGAGLLLRAVRPWTTRMSPACSMASCLNVSRWAAFVRTKPAHHQSSSKLIIRQQVLPCMGPCCQVHNGT